MINSINIKRGEKKMKTNLRVVDFQTDQNTEIKVGEILDANGAEIDDWMEKEYGILLWVKVSDENRDQVKREIRNLHGADCTDVDENGI